MQMFIKFRRRVKCAAAAHVRSSVLGEVSFIPIARGSWH
jgi:hypothetical protein